MAKEAIPTWCFSIVVVRRGDHYLLVHERKFGQTWYLPAGRVERGETFEQAAIRETIEETGVPVRLTGVLRIEHSPGPTEARMRVIFLAEPVDGTPPKSVPDQESLGADWFTVRDLSRLALRGDDVREWLEYVQAGGRVHPLDLFQREGMPVVAP